MSTNELEQEGYRNAQKLSQMLVKIVQELFFSNDIDQDIASISELEQWNSKEFDPQKKRKVFIRAIVDSTLCDLWLDESVTGDYLGYISCLDAFPTEDQLRESTMNILSKLHTEEETMLNMRYGIGVKTHTVAEIAEYFGNSVEYVNRTISNALRKIGTRKDFV